MRARMELERLRAEKEENERNMKAEAERRQTARAHPEPSPSRHTDTTPRPAAADSPVKANNSSSQMQERDDRGDAGGRGYEPDGYGRDDPYRRQEDVERERAAQLAAAAALSPATGIRESSGNHQPKVKPQPKVTAVLGRGQEEVVEASTGARLIQARQIPPASPVIAGKVGLSDSQAGKQQAPSARDSPKETKAKEPHGKTRGEPSRLLLAERPGKQHGLHGTTVQPLSDKTTHGETSVQWLTLRRDGSASGSHTQADAEKSGVDNDKQSPPSAWAQAANPGRTGGSVSNGPTLLDRSKGLVEHDRTAGQDFRNPHMMHAGDSAVGPPSPFGKGKEAGRSFSSLFVPPSHHREKSDGGVGHEDMHNNPAVGDSRGAGFPQGARGAGVELGRDWPEAGRGPPPQREQRRIFDHKTGKMRDVEVGDEYGRVCSTSWPMVPTLFCCRWLCSVTVLLLCASTFFGEDATWGLQVAASARKLLCD